MPEYLSPGVYVEEIDAGPKPIEGVSTSTAGAVGVTVRGPTDGKPELVTSYAEFARKFGGVMSEPDNEALINAWAFNATEGGQWWQFALSVKGFFDNGGQRLYVKRVFSGAATRASVVCAQGILASITDDGATNARQLRIAHLIGIQNGTAITIYANGNPLPTTFHVTSYSGTGTIVLDAPVPQELKSGRDFVEILPLTAVGAAADQLRIEAYSHGDWGGTEDDPTSGLSVRIGPMVGATLQVMADSRIGGPTVATTLSATAPAGANAVTVTSVAGLSRNDRVTIDGNVYTLTNVPRTTIAAQPAVNATDILVADRTGLVNNDQVSIDGRIYTLTNVDVGAQTTVGGAANPNPNDSTITFTAPAGFVVNDDVEIDGHTFRLSAAPAASPAGSFNIAPPVPAGAAWVSGTTVIRRLPRMVTINPGAAAAWPVGTDIWRLQPEITTVAAAGALRGAVTIPLTAVAGINPGNVVEINLHNFTVEGVDAPNNTINITPPAGADWGAGTSVRQPSRPSSIQIAPSVPTEWRVGTAVRRLRPANDPANPTDTINVRGAASLYTGAIVEFDDGQNKEVGIVDSVNGDAVTFTQNVDTPLFEGFVLRVIEAQVDVRYRQNNAIEHMENYSNLRLVNDGTLSYIVTNINERSRLIRLVAGDNFGPNALTEMPSVPPAAAGEPQLMWARLIGGADNLNQLTPDDFVGVDGGSGQRTGIQALEDIDEISICLAPGMWSQTVHNALIQHCETLKDRFAIIDPQDDLEIEEIRGVRAGYDTKYAALYYPWVIVRDFRANRFVNVGPSGHMAGIYARVDVERGVHKAPANEVIRGIRSFNANTNEGGIAADVTKRQQDMLNPQNINALRFFPGRGQRVWGARTLSSDSSWKYINVRRLFIFVEESIDEGTQWVVFEPNDEPLWARVRQTIRNFLTTVWRSGALQGQKADEAFFVKVDRTTMTQDDIDNGRLICVIGIAPVKPAEFVIFRIQQKTFEAAPA